MVITRWLTPVVEPLGTFSWLVHQHGVTGHLG